SADLGRPVYAEPDFLQQPPLHPLDIAAAAVGGSCSEGAYTPDWGPIDTLTFGWHLGDAFSGLKAARDRVGDRVSASGRRVRIGNTWLHLGTGALAAGINHAVGWGCDVISLSAGGLPAQSWADAVNHAYDQGCCIFAASGDSRGGLPTHLTIYPARFQRVVS